MSKDQESGVSGRNIPVSIPSNALYCSDPEKAPSEAFIAGFNRESGERRQETGNGCRLFGIQLVDIPSMEETSLAGGLCGLDGEDKPVPSLDADSDQQSQPSNMNQTDFPAVSSEPEKSCLRSSQEMQSKQTRSCTKVHMQGISVGRAVDLTKLDCYHGLLTKLEEMFDIKGELCDSTKKWQVVYTDDEGDMMLVGDDPWHEFCSMVKKIFIYTYEEAKRLTPMVMSSQQ